MKQQAGCIYPMTRWKADYADERRWSGNLLEIRFCSQCALHCSL